MFAWPALTWMSLIVASSLPPFTLARSVSSFDCGAAHWVGGARGGIPGVSAAVNPRGCRVRGGGVPERKSGGVCPCHEYAFELGSGRNVTIPRLCDDQRAFEVRIADGRVMIRIDEG